MTTTPTPTRMTAADHYEIADEVRRGDLRRVSLSFADHQERTKKARAEVRHAIIHREMPMVWQAPEMRRRDRERAGLKTSPVTRVIYLATKPDTTLTLEGIKATARAKWEAKRVSLVSASFLPAYESCKYRRSMSSWAGGEHSINIRIAGKNGVVQASGENNRVWSSNNKWSGNNSTHTFVVRMNWLDIPESARVVSGLLTLECGPAVERAIYPATWVEQGRGVTLNTVHGYLVSVERGQEREWIHAETLVGARRLLTMPRVSKNTTDLNHLDAASLLKRARLNGNERVDIETAHEAGNCYAGIRDWCGKHGIDVTTETSVTTLEIAKLAAASQDRVREVYAVLIQVAKVKRASRSSEVCVAAP